MHTTFKPQIMQCELTGAALIATARARLAGAGGVVDGGRGPAPRASGSAQRASCWRDDFAFGEGRVPLPAGREHVELQRGRLALVGAGRWRPAAGGAHRLADRGGAIGRKPFNFAVAEGAPCPSRCGRVCSRAAAAVARAAAASGSTTACASLGWAQAPPARAARRAVWRRNGPPPNVSTSLGRRRALAGAANRGTARCR